jgi:hypothetical protein
MAWQALEEDEPKAIQENAADAVGEPRGSVETCASDRAVSTTSNRETATGRAHRRKWVSLAWDPACRGLRYRCCRPRGARMSASTVCLLASPSRAHQRCQATPPEAASSPPACANRQGRYPLGRRPDPQATLRHCSGFPFPEALFPPPSITPAIASMPKSKLELAEF